MLAAIATVGLVIVALAGLIPHSYRSAMLVGALVVMPVALLQLQRGISQGLGRIVLAQAPGELLRPTLFVAFLISAAAMRLPVEPRAYLAAIAVTACIALALALPLMLRHIRTEGPATAGPAERRRWRAEAMPYLAISLVGIALGEINTLLLGWLATPHEAGLFSSRLPGWRP